LGPTLAEIARTLLRGRLPAVLRVNARPDPLYAVHATDHLGAPLLLVAEDGPTARLLDARGLDAAVGSLSVEDVPPFVHAPTLGHAAVLGPIRRLEAGAAREAVLRFADANPVAELFDVGEGTAMYRLEVRQVRLEAGDTVHDIDPDTYREAVPDPLHDEESDLLADLANHHAAQIGAYLARSLTAAGIRVAQLPLPVRLDRYGFVIALDPAAHQPRWLRLDFPAALRDRHELANFLHPILFHADCTSTEPPGHA